MTTIIEGIDGLKAKVCEHLGYSDWVEITQDQVNRFADATGDHQWIHVDVERCKREMPGGKTIAHGWLTLSLVPRLASTLYRVKQRSRGINYGANRVRFTSPPSMPTARPRASTGRATRSGSSSPTRCGAPAASRKRRRNTKPGSGSARVKSRRSPGAGC